MMMIKKFIKNTGAEFTNQICPGILFYFLRSNYYDNFL